jgi:hypothetical protein
MTAPRFLDDDDFAHIVRHAPLVSIDIVIKDSEGNVLLGLRAPGLRLHQEKFIDRRQFCRGKTLPEIVAEMETTRPARLRPPTEAASCVPLLAMLVVYGKHWSRCHGGTN